MNMKKIISMILVFGIVVSSVSGIVFRESVKAEEVFTSVPTIVETPKPMPTYDNPFFVEPTPVVTPSPTPTVTPKFVFQYKHFVTTLNKYGRFSTYGNNRINPGGTVDITKGFNLKLKLMYITTGFDDINTAAGETYKGETKWDTSDSSIATVNGDGTVSAKKVGKAVITVSYDGRKSSVTVDVKKNQYKGKMDRFGLVHLGGKSQGTLVNSVTSVKYDKKGNLICKCVVKYTPNKYGKKTRKDQKCKKQVRSILITGEGGKKILYTVTKKGGYDISPKRPVRRFTIKIPKKKIKGKWDLRNVAYHLTTYFYTR